MNMRVLAGLLAAAFAAPMAFGFLMAAQGEFSIFFAMALGAFMLIFGMPIALAAGVIALPAFLLFELRWPGRWWTAGLVGALTGYGIALLMPRWMLSSDVALVGAGLASGLAFRAGFGKDREGDDL